MAEWWYNTSFRMAIKSTPYEIVYGQTPPLHVPYLAGDSHFEAVDRDLTHREALLKMLKNNLHKAQNRMRQLANKKRSKREL